jgi:hypothetical protein
MILQHKHIYWSSSFVTIYLYENNIIHADWCGYVSVDEVKEGCERMLLSVKENNCGLVINDNRRVKGSWTQAIKWLEEDYLPRLIKANLKKIAFLYSPEPGARYSVNRLLEVSAEYEGQAFEDFEQAAKWITNHPLVENHKTVLIKTGGEFIRIPTDEISYISMVNRKTQLRTCKQEILTNHSLNELMELLPKPQFFRIHKSYIVNTDMIQSLKYLAGGYYKIYLKDMGKNYLIVSRTCAKELKSVLVL